MSATSSIQQTSSFSTSCEECPICYEVYDPSGDGIRTPVLLTFCGHTFCRGCLNSLANKTSLATMLTCPLCCKVTALTAPGEQGVRALSKNFALIELIGVLHSAKILKEKPQSCTLCSNTATIFCEQCDALLCASCEASEHTGKLSSRHTRIPASSKRPSEPKCATHPKKDADLFCKECQLLCCLLCKEFGKHKGHELILWDSAADATKISISSTVNMLAQDLETSTQVCKTLEASMIKLRNDTTTAEQQIEAKFNQLFSALTQRKTELLEELARQNTIATDGLKKKIGISEYRSVIETGKRLTNSQEHAYLLHVLPEFNATVQTATQVLNKFNTSTCLNVVSFKFEGNANTIQELSKFGTISTVQDPMPVVGSVSATATATTISLCLDGTSSLYPTSLEADDCFPIRGYEIIVDDVKTPVRVYGVSFKAVLPASSSVFIVICASPGDVLAQSQIISGKVAKPSAPDWIDVPLQYVLNPGNTYLLFFVRNGGRSQFSYVPGNNSKRHVHGLGKVESKHATCLATGPFVPSPNSYSVDARILTVPVFAEPAAAATVTPVTSCKTPGEVKGKSCY